MNSTQLKKLTLKERLNWSKPLFFNQKTPVYPWIVFSIVTFISMCAGFTAFTGMIASSSIQGSLALGDTEVVWSSVIFLLVVANMVPLSGFFIKKFGLKTVFFVATIIFYLGSFLSGLSVNFLTFFCSRIIEGIGGGLIFPVSVGLISLSIQEKSKALALSLYASLTFGIGATLGFWLGGILPDSLGWRTTYLYPSYFFPLALISIILTINETKKTQPSPLDLWGGLFYILFIGASISWLGNVKLGWNTGGFTSNFSLFLIFLTVISLTCFLIRTKTSKSPFILLSLFKTKSFLIGSSALFVVGLTFFSAGGDFGQILIENLFYQKSVAGTTLMYYGIILGITGILTGFLTERIGSIPVIMIGLGLNIMSGFFGHSLTIQSDPGAWIMILIVKGAGIGFSLGPLTAFALSEIPQEYLPAGAAISTLLRQLGASVGSLFTGLIKEIRIPFHLLRFGEQMNLQSPSLLKHLHLQGYFLIDQAGKSPSMSPIIEPRSDAFKSELYSSSVLQGSTYSPEILEGSAIGNATEISTMQLMENAKFQANILSTCDAYWILSWILLLFLGWIIYIIFLKKFKCKNSKK